VIDFNKLSRPTATSAPLDPLEIFARSPNLKDAPNDLWKGQAEALGKWHNVRTASDTAIALNTGAGKSIVGVLIAQSLVNEKIGPVLFACSTIDLVMQTTRECDRMGIKYSVRTEGSFNNDLYETGVAFCITTYQALFSPMNAFRGNNAPSAVLFDDAHVSERMIRDSFTLSVSKSKFGELYDDIIGIVRPHFEAINKGSHLDFVLDDVGQQSVTMCPPSTAHKTSKQIIEALKRANYRKQSDLFFPVAQLYEHLHHCAIFVSSDAVEITPPFIPTGVFTFLGDGCRRVYLSATLEYETVFVRGFGRKAANRIEPDNDAGNGERLILLANEFDKSADKIAVAQQIMRAQKLLVTVTSYPKAKPWAGVASPPAREAFSDALQRFRTAREGAFILVSRIDGIDLPQDTCRVMLIDGAPSGSSLMEQYLFRSLQLGNLYSTKMASRITQLLGRINRGRSDYGAFVIYGNDINAWMKRERNISLLPSLIRKQIILGQSLQKDIGKSKPADVTALINQIISRDGGWLAFYRDTIDGLDVSADVANKVKAREAQLSLSAIEECKFMTCLWQEDAEGARKAILDVLDSTALVDAGLAGWYSIWLGMTYENAGDVETALAHYRRSRSRLSSWLNVPIRSQADAAVLTGGPKTLFQECILTVDRHGPQALGDFIAKLRARSRMINDGTASSNQHEEALRMFGELLGYRATRPDNESGLSPDVVWIDDDNKVALPFELKTKKENPARYTKAEIGQSHNHLQWMKDVMGDFRSDKLLVVGPIGTCGKEASPSPDICFVQTDFLFERLSLLAAKIEDCRGRTALERWTALNELGGLPEWQLDGWRQTLATIPIGSLTRV